MSSGRPAPAIGPAPGLHDHLRTRLVRARAVGRSDGGGGDLPRLRRPGSACSTVRSTQNDGTRETSAVFVPPGSPAPAGLGAKCWAARLGRPPHSNSSSRSVLGGELAHSGPGASDGRVAFALGLVVGRRNLLGDGRHDALRCRHVSTGHQTCPTERPSLTPNAGGRRGARDMVHRRCFQTLRPPPAWTGLPFARFRPRLLRLPCPKGLLQSGGRYRPLPHQTPTAPEKLAHAVCDSARTTLIRPENLPAKAAHRPSNTCLHINSVVVFWPANSGSSSRFL